MRKIITLKTIFTTILLSSINCGNYNQIRKVNKLAFNSNEQFVHEISRIRKIENNLIQIFVHTSTSTNSYPKINFEEKCFYLKLEENNKTQFYHYNVDKIYLMDECDFEFISRLFFSSISKERFETYKNNLKDEVIRLKFFNSLKPIYYEIELEERNFK
ncbi:Hypothetical protein LBF_2133 [Leptospira biflexa serovar Patoc strain 'Patoc 1 (Ames)']|uniref:Uncharacterized protein n=1 Tax=Leptospira biflexa serovar Patoc (strain Patoc 1 / ATCC 23582 / Paris) TaxID=456481 RepID=B0ST53_LEPBP|nr:Hypothetical protein LBF_2133 [Leptospira biflexa serovar Patoc strain 'Patoc 1 (Ames)']ABZ98293.1 Hypothetical protein LEPBI_I2194 [Leptospira biflexa serovar Patoc strain 'Patoc 1 (Paris)']